jgi:hypothetical protein
VQRVTLRLRPPPPDLGLSEATVPPADDGYALPSLVLGLPGTWDVEVRVRRANTEDVSARFQLPIADSAPAAPAASPATAPPPPPAAPSPPGPEAPSAGAPATAVPTPTAAPTAALPTPASAATSGAASTGAAAPPGQQAEGPGPGQIVGAAVILLALVTAAVALPRLLRQRRR